MENYIDNLDLSYILIIGWMDTEVFAEWFVEFVNAIKEQPLLLTFDGHMTLVSLPVIEKALQDKIIMLKFPPHATDVLQPLDVSCFGSLKHCWDNFCNNKSTHLVLKQHSQRETSLINFVKYGKME